MEWTTEKPTVPGFYWWRLSRDAIAEGYEPRIAHVRLEWEHMPGRKKPYPVELGRLFVPYSDGEWAGPIPLPVEPSNDEPAAIVAQGSPADRLSLVELQRHWVVNEAGDYD